ncbi:MAG: low molecular weight phosphotyrosine protein phosphatase [Sphaerochaetaceae bacterium]|nr:low molecular weight phosphotyrosine protein phosphatase [Sphaerochaetaceae bacterium]
MIKVLFLCHGNICRSPIAQYVFRRLVYDYGLSSVFEIDSAATSTEEIGNPVYPPARKVLAQHGITDVTHRARQLTRSDYKHFDYILVMDNWNMRNALRMTDNDPDHKISLLYKAEIEDPWYTGGFDRVYNQIEKGCIDLLDKIFSFYGADGVRTDKKILLLYGKLFSLWCKETCAPRMQERWCISNRTLGQCSITSFLVQDVLGGDVYGSRLPSGDMHCFNKIDGKLYDLTSDQIDQSPDVCDYVNISLQSREEHFSKEEKYQRYLYLKSLLKH